MFIILAIVSNLSVEAYVFELLDKVLRNLANFTELFFLIIYFLCLLHYILAHVSRFILHVNYFTPDLVVIKTCHILVHRNLDIKSSIILL